MTELEKVEKLRERTNVSYAEAKEALEKAGGDLLGALIYLENQGKVASPNGGGFYSGAGTPGAESKSSYNSENGTKRSGEGFADVMRKIGEACLDLLRKGTVNYLDATKNGVAIFSCPIIVLIILLLFFFWVTLPLIIISLFFGIRYRFSGPDLGRDSVNKVMDSTSDLVNDVKRSFTEGANKTNGESR